MKVMLATFLLDPALGAGSAVAVGQLAGALTAEGVEVVVLTTWAGKTVGYDRQDGLRVVRLPCSNLYWVAHKDSQPMYRRAAWQVIDTWNPLMYRLARHIVEAERPDIFHSHKLRGLSPAIWTAAKAARVSGIVHTCHDFEALSPQGLLMGRVGQAALHRSLLMRPYQAVRRHASKAVRAVTAPSRFVLNMHRDMGFFPSANSRVVEDSHGFSMSDLLIGERALREARKTITGSRFLYIGRLDSAKGIEVLCQAFTRFSSRNPGTTLRIAGSGPLEAQLRRQYAGNQAIEFLGMVSGPEKDRALCESDVLVAPSIAAESFGIVIAEAFAYGLPVLAARVGAYPQLVSEGETGCLVQPGSAEALEEKLSEMAASPARLRAMAGNCFVRARDFTIEKMAAEYVSTYGAAQ